MCRCTGLSTAAGGTAWSPTSMSSPASTGAAQLPLSPCCLLVVSCIHDCDAAVSYTSSQHASLLAHCVNAEQVTTCLPSSFHGVSCPLPLDAECLSALHCSVVYEYGTPDESFEWTQIRGATGGEVQVLDDTVDLMQVPARVMVLLHRVGRRKMISCTSPLVSSASSDY